METIKNKTQKSTTTKSTEDTEIEGLDKKGKNCDKKQTKL